MRLTGHGRPRVNSPGPMRLQFRFCSLDRKGRGCTPSSVSALDRGVAPFLGSRASRPHRAEGPNHAPTQATPPARRSSATRPRGARGGGLCGAFDRAWRGFGKAAAAHRARYPRSIEGVAPFLGSRASRPHRAEGPNHAPLRLPPPHAAPVPIDRAAQEAGAPRCVRPGMGRLSLLAGPAAGCPLPASGRGGRDARDPRGAPRRV